MKNRLKVLRAERNWTQAQLADALDVSRQTVNAIETGKFDPSLPLAFKAARLFGMRIEEIFHDQEPAPPWNSARARSSSRSSSNRTGSSSGRSPRSRHRRARW